MAVSNLDLNQIILDLQNTLQTVYSIEKKLYDIFLNTEVQDVPITYTDLNGQTVTVKIPSIAKLQQTLDQTFQNYLNKASFVNLLKDPLFLDAKLSSWKITSSLNYKAITADLTNDDMVDLSILLGFNAFSPTDGIVGSFKKLVIDIATFGEKSDVQVYQTYTDAGILAYHPNAIRYGAFIKINNKHWTNDLSNVLPANGLTQGRIWEIHIGNLSHVEIFLPYSYGTFNKGLVVVR